MNLHPRRYVFRGHSSGVSAHIRRPDTRLLPVQGCSSLPVTGGFHEMKLGAGKLEDLLSYESIGTSAHGDYVNVADGVATTHEDDAFDRFPVRIHVTASVKGLVILGRVRIGHAAIGLISHSAVGGAQPSILLEGNVLEDVTIDGSRLNITLAEKLYRECDTLDKLAAKHDNGLQPYHKGMFMPAQSKDTEVTSFPVANGTVKCTVVQELTWEGAKHPNAEIYGHVVRIPDFGKIYFGEMFVTDHSRRLTMVRAQLGSPHGGEIVAADGEPSGPTFPPT